MPLSEGLLFLLYIIYNALIIIILVVSIRTFLISPFRVIGSSMADTLISNEFILIDKLNYHLGEPQRGDPIVFLPPITNKYPYKFQETITTDNNGKGVLDIGGLKTKKNVFYCKNIWIQNLWLCQDKVKADDFAYFRAIGDRNGGDLIDLSWKRAQKKNV